MDPQESFVISESIEQMELVVSEAVMYETTGELFDLASFFTQLQFNHENTHTKFLAVSKLTLQKRSMILQ